MGKKNVKHKKIEKHKMESEIKTCSMNDTFGGHFVFFMSFIYCKTTSTPLISTFVKYDD